MGLTSPLFIEVPVPSQVLGVSNLDFGNVPVVFVV
jgi:hypothetical protein